MDARPYRIDPTTAKQSIEAGTAVVIDLTSPLIATAVKGRIPGSLWVSPKEILDRNKTIIAYCTCPEEEASARLTRVLREQGYDAWTLVGGLPGWRAAGFPMEANLAA
jgi:rhodanese-related sulfurtransferase